MPQDDNKVIEVKVSAIDGDFLVLETIPDGQTLQWPISNIPKPLRVGSTLLLELKSSGMTLSQNHSVTASTVKSNNDGDSRRDEDKRRLLEQLVN